MDQSTINFKVYEDGTEHLGIATLTLPNVAFITQTISGAGIGGNVEAPVVGMLDAMTLGINFRTFQKNQVSLTEPKRHTIECRSAQQVEDPVKGFLDVDAIKHVFVVLPKSMTGGTVQPAAPTDGSGEYACRYWKATINGEVMLELDPFNNICVINGTDYLASVKKALDG